MVHAAIWKTVLPLADGMPAFNNNAVQALQSLIKEDTVIVLTTSHRYKFSIDEWKKIFRNRNLEIKNLEILQDVSKKDGIFNYPKTSDYLIIDDDTRLNALPSEIKKHLILTSPLIGLTDEDIKFKL